MNICLKHALTQEIVYKGLLRKERKDIHERIGLVMEQLFQERLPEFYEVLAFHFFHGHSVSRAVTYLIESGEKSLKRYSVEESHQYFQKAFDLISGLPVISDAVKEDLIDLLNRWAFVYYYRGDFKGLDELFKANEKFAQDIANKQKSGMFFALLGMAVWMRSRFKEAYGISTQSKKIRARSPKSKGCWILRNLVIMGMHRYGDV